MPDPARRSPCRRPPFVSSLGRELGLACLAMILYAKFGEHQPLNRQSDSFAREGIDLDVSSLADWVGAYTATGKILAQAFLMSSRATGIPRKCLSSSTAVANELWPEVGDGVTR
jgi:transposase